MKTGTCYDGLSAEHVWGKAEDGREICSRCHSVRETSLQQAVEKYLEPYTEPCASARYCTHDVRCAFQDGAKWALERAAKVADENNMSFTAKAIRELSVGGDTR